MATYPSISTYCYAANSPVILIDENGEGPSPPLSVYTTWAILNISPATLGAIRNSNNTSLRQVEKWALNEDGYDKATPWKLKGAIGEGMALLIIQQIAGEFYRETGIQSELRMQVRTTKLTNRSCSDITFSFETVSYVTPRGVEGQQASMTWNNTDGTTYVENFRADLEVEGYKTEEFKFQFEVKTLTPQTTVRGLRNSARALNHGLNQLEGRGDDHDPVLLTDYNTYMNVYNASKNGGRVAKKFVEHLENFMQDGGRLMLIHGLNDFSTEQVEEIREGVIKANERAKF